MLVAENILLDALRLRRRGLSVFPVAVENKKPAVSWDKYQDRLPTEEEIEKDFSYAESKFGQCAIGIAMGPVSNSILLDFDFAKHPEARQFFEKNKHRIPRSWTEETSSGGLHVYFRWDKQLDAKQTNTTSILEKGIDTKGYGGYSKITPSPGYRWIIPPHMAPLAACPQWLIDSLKPKEGTKIIKGFIAKPEDWMIRELESIVPNDPVKGRTPTFTRAIGRLKAKGLTELETKKFLLPYALQYEHPDIEGLVADQFRRYPQRPDLHKSPLGDSDESFSKWVDTDEKVEWIVPKLIPEESIGFMAGLPEACKTWLLIDLAVEVARGGVWMGKFKTRGGKVIYIDQERPSAETKRRFRAIAAAKEIPLHSLDSQLIVRTGSTIRLDLQNSYEAFDRYLGEKQPSIVLIDSFKTFHTKNELATQDMQLIMQKLKELRTKHHCAFLFIHHETKSVFQKRKEGEEVSYLDASGTIDLPQTSETFFNVVAKGESESMVYHTKNNYGSKMAPFLVKVIDLVPDKSKIAVEAY